MDFYHWRRWHLQGAVHVPKPRKKQQDDDINSALLHRNVSRRDVSELKTENDPFHNSEIAGFLENFRWANSVFGEDFAVFLDTSGAANTMFAYPHESQKIRLNMQQQLKPSPDIQDQSTRPGKHTKTMGKSPFYSWENHSFDWAIFNSFLYVYQRVLFLGDPR